jgi:hypothetical protein
MLMARQSMVVETKSMTAASAIAPTWRIRGVDAATNAEDVELEVGTVVAFMETVAGGGALRAVAIGEWAAACRRCCGTCTPAVARGL